MQISEILPAEGTKVISSASSKKQLFRSLAEMAEGCFEVETASVVDALLDRESLGPTGVGHGVALPHARMPGLDRVCGLFLRLKKPLDFNAVDRQPVDLVFALFAPESASVEHLKALALVSRTLRDDSVCSKLRSNDDPATLFTILTEHATSQAA